MSTHYQLNKNVKFKNLMIKKVMKYCASTYGWKIPMVVFQWKTYIHTQSPGVSDWIIVLCIT